MHTTLPSLDRRALLLASASIVTVTLLAGCDGDRPTEPAKPVAAPSAKVSRYTGPTLEWSIIDENKALITIAGAEFQLVGPNQSITFVHDNAAGDANSKVGEVRVTGLPAGKYTVCEISSVSGYLAVKPLCFVGNVSNGATIIGPFFNPHAPVVMGGVKDEVGNWIGPASFTIADGSPPPPIMLADNSNYDMNPFIGGFQFQLWQTTFTLCEAVPPQGFVIPAGQPCVTWDAQYGQTKNVGVFENHRPYSANWGVTDGNVDLSGNYVPLGGAIFKVQFPNNAGFLFVSDNGPNDYDKRPGRLAMQLPLVGSYMICETQAPANHWLPKPACGTVNATYGVPAQGRWFINHEAQVPTS